MRALSQEQASEEYDVTFAARRGENPFKAAERELARRYKVRDYLIFDAYLTQTGFLDRSEI